MKKSVFSFLRDKRGVSALEYSILAGLIVLGVVAGVSTSNLKTSVQTIFQGVSTAVDNAAQ